MTDLAEVLAAGRAFLTQFLDERPRSEHQALVAGMRPGNEDYDRVFVGEAAARAREQYGPLWDAGLAIDRKPQQSRLLCHAAFSEDFANGHARLSAFPGGYKQIAAFLQPGVAWICWKFVAPGTEDGMAYDGLVRLDERWIWLPKPWRVLRVPSAAPHPWIE